MYNEIGLKLWLKYHLSLPEGEVKETIHTKSEVESFAKVNSSRRTIPHKFWWLVVSSSTVPRTKILSF